MLAFGNAWKKVSSSLRIVGSSVSYSGTYSENIPPGFRCCFTASKYSFEYSAAVPFTNTSSGSDAMMSNFSVVVSR